MGEAGLPEIGIFLDLYESHLFGSGDGPGATVNVQFAVDVLGVGFYRIQGNKKFIGDFPV